MWIPNQLENAVSNLWLVEAPCSKGRLSWSLSSMELGELTSSLPLSSENSRTSFDSTVSPLHAQIQPIGNSVFCKDWELAVRNL